MWVSKRADSITGRGALVFADVTEYLGTAKEASSPATLYAIFLES